MYRYIDTDRLVFDVWLKGLSTGRASTARVRWSPVFGVTSKDILEWM